jgi:hypothetical protein
MQVAAADGAPREPWIAPEMPTDIRGALQAFPRPPAPKWTKGTLLGGVAAGLSRGQPSLAPPSMELLR